MGGGTDVAQQAAGLTLMRGDPRGVPLALQVARFTEAKIRQNLFWAFAYNAVGLPLAWPSVLANPMLAGAAMAASSVSGDECAVAAAEDCEAGLDLLLVQGVFPWLTPHMSLLSVASSCRPTSVSDWLTSCWRP